MTITNKPDKAKAKADDPARIHPELGPLTQADMLRYLDDISALYTTSDYLRATGLPDAAVPLAESHLALALHGVRQALLRWHPVPPISDPSEIAAFYDALRELLATRMADVLGSLQTIVGTNATRTQAALMQWNRERSVYDERALERAAKVAFSEPKPDYDHMEVVDLGDGKRAARYRIKPEPEREGGRQP